MLLAREASAAARYDTVIKESLQKIAEDQKRYIEYTALFDGDIAAQAKKLIRQIDDISAVMGIVRRNSTKLVAEGKFDEATALFSAEYGPQFRKLAPVYAELVNLTTRSSKENMLDAIALGIMAKNTGLVLSLIAVVISIIITYLLTRSVMRQLGKDPGQLNALARRVVDGDYEIADGSARIGVYDSIVSMVESLKANMEKAHDESLNAQNQAAKATEAMRNAEESGKIAQSKSSAMLAAGLVPRRSSRTQIRSFSAAASFLTFSPAALISSRLSPEMRISSDAAADRKLSCFQRICASGKASRYLASYSRTIFSVSFLVRVTTRICE